MGRDTNYTANEICKRVAHCLIVVVYSTIKVNKTFEVTSVDIVVNLFTKLLLDESRMLLSVKLELG